MFFRTVPTEFALGKTRRFLTPSLCGAAGTNCATNIRVRGQGLSVIQESVSLQRPTP